MTVVIKPGEPVQEWLARRWGVEGERWKKVASAYLDIAEDGDKDGYDQTTAEREAVSHVVSLVDQYLKVEILDPDEDVMRLLARISELMI